MAFVLRSFSRPARQCFNVAAQGSPNYIRLLATGSAKHTTSSSAAVADGDTAARANANELKLNVSDSCIIRLREICKDGSTFLRITVEGGGCSGFQYKFDLDNKLNADDVTFGEENAKVAIDNVSLEYCTGATIDYHTELIRSGFRVLANPQAEQGCSCGASFAIKLD